jgi:hypothetical protein
VTKSALSQHEELCEQRYGEINRRLDRIEMTIDNIERSIDGFKNFVLQGAIKVGIGAIIALFSAVYVVKFH